MKPRKIEKVSFSFDDGSFLDWYRLDNPVISHSGLKMWWRVETSVGSSFSSGNPSVSYSSFLIDSIEASVTLDEGT